MMRCFGLTPFLPIFPSLCVVDPNHLHNHSLHRKPGIKNGHHRILIPSIFDSICSSSEHLFTHRRCCRIAKSRTNSLLVCSTCPSDGRETAASSHENVASNQGLPAAQRISDVVNFSNTRNLSAQSVYGSFDEQLSCLLTSDEPRETLDQDSVPSSTKQAVAPSIGIGNHVRNGYRGSRGRGRGVPSRAAKLNEFVSKTCAADQRENKFLLSGYGNRVNYESVSADVPFSASIGSSVFVFWDLDDKPPKSSPYTAALDLRHAATRFGDVVDMVAYAKHYASRHIAERVREYRCQGKQIDLLKRNGIGPAEKCSLFARKCKNSFLLKRHIKQVHKREHLRRINTQISFESDFQRAGVSVDTVQCKPQAIGFKLKKHLLGSMSKGITCICLVSDDLGFSSLLADAQTLKIFVIVFGVSGCLKKYADYWFPWDEISQGLPAEDVQKAIHAWLCYHSIVHSTELNELGVSKVGANAEVECKDFSKSAVQRGAEPSTVVYEEPLASSDEDEPLSDDEKEWIYDDEIDELDDSWVDID